MDEINIGPKRDFRLPGRRWLVLIAAAGLIAAAAALTVTSSSGRHVPRSPRPPAAAAAASRPPAGVSGTLLLTCDSANWGQLPANWRTGSLQAGPLWFVYDRPPGYVHRGGLRGRARTADGNGELRDGVMIVEVADGSTVVMKVAPAARSYFRFVDGFNGPRANKLPDGETGFTFISCPRGTPAGPNGRVTDFYLGFQIAAGRTAPVNIWASATARPIRVTFT